MNRHKNIIYRIAYHISDPETWRSYALVCKICRNAVRYWEKPKKTEISVAGDYYHFLPNGAAHGPTTREPLGYYINGYGNNSGSNGYIFKCGDFIVYIFTDEEFPEVVIVKPGVEIVIRRSGKVFVLSTR